MKSITPPPPGNIHLSSAGTYTAPHTVESAQGRIQGFWSRGRRTTVYQGVGLFERVISGHLARCWSLLLIFYCLCVQEPLLSECPKLVSSAFLQTFN